jgi:hypothetical protein
MGTQKSTGNNDVTYRLLFSILLTYKYQSKMIDVEIVIHYGNLEAKIYVKIPKCLMTKKEMY